MIKPLHEGQVRPQDVGWYENEYGYWFGYANHPVWKLTSQDAPSEDEDQADAEQAALPVPAR